MAIYGVAILAGCLIVGSTLGRLVGAALDIDKDVGGVGIAMVLLIAVTAWSQRRGLMPEATRGGVLFWSAVYIPIVVAMAAKQNVVAALSGGPAALLAGTLSVAAAFALVPVLARGGSGTPDAATDTDQ